MNTEKTSSRKEKRFQTRAILFVTVMLLFLSMPGPGKEGGAIPLYRLFFSEEEWSQAPRPVPGTMISVPENLFRKGPRAKNNFILGVVHAEKESSEPIHFISDDTHEKIISELKSGDPKSLYLNARRFFLLCADERNPALSYEPGYVIHEALVINHYYNRFDSGPEALTALYYAMETVHRLTLPYETLLHPGRAGNEPAYSSYCEFRKNPSAVKITHQNQILGILNYLTFDFLVEMNSEARAAGGAPPVVLKKSAKLFFDYGRHAEAAKIFEVLTVMEPRNEKWLVRLGKCHSVSMDPGFDNVMKKALSLNPALQDEFEMYKRDMVLTVKTARIRAELNNAKGEDFRKKWIETAELLLEAKQINDFVQFFESADGRVTQTKEYSLIRLNYLQETIFRWVPGAVAQSIFQPGQMLSIFTQNIRQNSEIISRYYDRTMEAVGEFPREDILFGHLVASTCGVLALDLINKAPERLQSGSGKSGLTAGESMEVAAMVKKRWDLSIIKAKDLVRTPFQKKVHLFLNKAGNIIFSRLMSGEFWKSVGDENFIQTPYFELLWRDAALLAQECASLQFGLEFRVSGEAQIVTHLLVRLNRWMHAKQSLTEFRSSVADLTGYFKETNQDTPKLLAGVLSSVMKYGDGLLIPMLSDNEIPDNDKMKIRELHDELHAVADAGVHFAGFYESEKVILNGRFWEATMNPRTYETALRMRERYLDRKKSALNYYRAQFLLTAYQRGGDEKFLIKAFHCLNEARADGDRVVAAPSNRFFSIASKNENLDKYVFQNLGFCLNSLRHQDAFFFAQFSRYANQDPSLSVMFVLDEVHANLRDNPGEYFRVLEELHRQNNETHYTDAGMKSMNSKQILRRLIDVQKSAGHSSPEKNYEKLYESLKEVNNPKPSSFSFGGGFGTASGLSLYAELFTFWFFGLPR